MRKDDVTTGPDPIDALARDRVGMFLTVEYLEGETA